MTKVKHGQYDHDRKLPDNTGHPQGSGVYIWLHSEVERYWPGLVEQSRQQKERLPNQWLLDQLKAMDDERAKAIFEEFRLRVNADQAERRQRNRKRDLARWKKQEETAQGDWLEHVQKRIAKLEKAIAERE